jgi:hypothetical protein
MINIPPTRQLADPGATGRQWAPSNSVANAVGGIGDAIGNLGDRLAAHQIKINRAKTSRDISERMLKLAADNAEFQNGMLTSPPEKWPSAYEAMFKKTKGGFDGEKGSLSQEGQEVFEAKAADFYSRSAIRISAASEMAIVTEARQARAFEIDLSKKNLDREGGMTAINEGSALGISQGEMEREAHEFNKHINLEGATMLMQNSLFTWTPEVLEGGGFNPDEVAYLTKQHKIAKGAARIDTIELIMDQIADPTVRVTVPDIQAYLTEGAIDNVDVAKLIKKRQEYTSTDFEGWSALFTDLRRYDANEDTPGKEKLEELMLRGAAMDLNSTEYGEMQLMIKKIKMGVPLMDDSMVPKAIADGVFDSLNIAFAGGWGMGGTAIDKPPAKRTPKEDEAITVRKMEVSKKKAMFEHVLREYIDQNDFGKKTIPEISNDLHGALDALLKKTNDQATATLFPGLAPTSIVAPPATGSSSATTTNVAPRPPTSSPDDLVLPSLDDDNALSDLLVPTNVSDPKLKKASSFSGGMGGL